MGQLPRVGRGRPYRSWRSATDTLLPDASSPADAVEVEHERAGTRLAIHLAVLDHLRARPHPSVIVIDDLQWADDATLALLAFLGPELERLRTLPAVGVRRAGSSEVAAGVRDCLVELARTTDPLHLELSRLDADDVADWISTRSGAVPEPAIVAHVADLTAGNPFYVRELLTLLESEGRLGAGFDGAPAAVPHAVQDVVRRRTSRLPPETQALLTVAAVIGRRFDLDVLAGVVGPGEGRGPDPSGAGPR